MSWSAAAFFSENFAGTVSVFAGAPGTAKAPSTNTLFCGGGWAAPGPTSDSAGGFTICALPDAVVATNPSAAHAVPKGFIAPLPCLLDSSVACGSKISTQEGPLFSPQAAPCRLHPITVGNEPQTDRPMILTEIARNHAASAYRVLFFGGEGRCLGFVSADADCNECLQNMCAVLIVRLVLVPVGKLLNPAAAQARFAAFVGPRSCGRYMRIYPPPLDLGFHVSTSLLSKGFPVSTWGALGADVETELSCKNKSVEVWKFEPEVWGEEEGQ